MKFGKNLLRAVELSDPEWGPYWMNYKFLKQKINEIVVARGEASSLEERDRVKDLKDKRRIELLTKSKCEVEFFRALAAELKKTIDFFETAQQLLKIRHARILDGYTKLKEFGERYDQNTWSRLLRACVKFYKDVLLLENFAIMNYCGFSKILKKHDKLTGFSTREAYMKNVMSQQNITHYPYVMGLLKQTEQLFADIQSMESVMPLEDEERLFIDAMRDLNSQATVLQEEESGGGKGESRAQVSAPASAVPVSECDGPVLSRSLHKKTVTASEAVECAASAVMAAACRMGNTAGPDLKEALQLRKDLSKSCQKVAFSDSSVSPKATSTRGGGGVSKVVIFPLVPVITNDIDNHRCAPVISSSAATNSTVDEVHAHCLVGEQSLLVEEKRKRPLEDSPPAAETSLGGVIDNHFADGAVVVGGGGGGSPRDAKKWKTSRTAKRSPVGPATGSA